MSDLIDRQPEKRTEKRTETRACDCISREAAIDLCDWYDNPSMREDLEKLPSAQPNTDLQNLAKEIAAFKRSFKSANSDYLTGYLSALSLVEGMIAGMIAKRRGEQDG